MKKCVLKALGAEVVIVFREMEKSIVLIGLVDISRKK